MQLSQTVEWALHSCLALAFLPEGARMPARFLAEYHGVKPAYLAKALQRLADAGVLAKTEGRRGGFALARPAAQITALEIVDALHPARSFFQCTGIRQQGPCAAPSDAYPKPCNIARMMRRADRAWRAELAATTLEALKQNAGQDAPDGVAERTAQWLDSTGAVRC